MEEQPPGSMEQASLAACREALRRATEALRCLPDVTWQGTGPDLAETLGEIGLLVLVADAAEVAVVADAADRGEPRGQLQATTATGWVVQHSPRYHSGAGAGRLTRVAEACRHPASRDTLGRAVLQARVPVVCAAAVVEQMRLLQPDLDPDAVPAVWQGFTQIAAGGDPREVRRLREAMIARYGSPQALDDEHELIARYESLSAGQARPDGLIDYRLRLAPVSAAAFEAALEPVSAPTPTEGMPDLRTRDRRRADALTHMIHRAVTAGGSVPAQPATQLHLLVSLADLVPAGRGSDRRGVDGRTGKRGHRESDPRPRVPAGSLAVSPDADPQLFAAAVATGTVDADGGAHTRAAGEPSAVSTHDGDPPDGPRAWHAGMTIGGLDAGRFIPIEAVRRLACDATVTPIVVDRRGDPLIVGRSKRLFTRQQTALLMVRDAGCTFPGCTAPAAWCDAHHLTHWADGGRTDLDNGALLCRRHHTLVHARRLRGLIATSVIADPAREQDPAMETTSTDGYAQTDRGRVVWDLAPGSYDRSTGRRGRPDPSSAA